MYGWEDVYGWGDVYGWEDVYGWGDVYGCTWGDKETHLGCTCVIHEDYVTQVYGPSVHPQALFSKPDFPHNLPAVWHRQWACMCTTTPPQHAPQHTPPHQNYPAVILGEWGGRAEPGSKDRVWMQAFAQFLIQLKIDVGFFWCLNPNSGDTGGLLQDDWTTPEVWKLELLHQITPAPTVFVSPGSGVGVQVGSGAQDGNEDDDRVYVV